MLGVARSIFPSRVLLGVIQLGVGVPRANPPLPRPRSRAYVRRSAEEWYSDAFFSRTALVIVTNRFPEL